MNKTRKKSPLTNFEKLSPNRNKPRNSPVSRLTPHHAAGNLSAKAILSLNKFQTYNPVTGSSTSYTIGSDGTIGLGVEETNRPWTTSNAFNDHRAITTEIANNGGAPDWRMSDEAINAWLDNSVDQCRFYGFNKVNYVPKPANVTPAKVESWIKTWETDDAMTITLHSWYTATLCPGPYFTRQLPWLVKEMNKRLADPSYVPEAFVGEGATSNVGSSKPSTPTKLKPINTVAQEVISGVWGNGTERTKKLKAAGYDPTVVQNKVNELMAAAPKPTPPVKEFVPYEVGVAVSALNVRKGPGVKYDVVRTLSNDPNTYTIVEEKSGPDGTGRNSKWGRLKSGLGWVLLSYTKRR